MRFYSNIGQHIEQVLNGLESDLGESCTFTDINQIDLTTGDIAFSYVVGDVDPIGYNDIGQESVEVEVELRLHVPTTQSDKPQIFAASLAGRMVGLLNKRFYGFSGQKQPVDVEQNVALPNTRLNNKVSYVARSIVFRQVVYVGNPTVDLYDVTFTGLEYVC